MSTLNVVMPLMVGDAVNVSIAFATWLAASTVPSWFQVTVNGPFAVEGFQFIFVMPSVTWAFPMFLT
jgi:hypothetical protein